jgi:hypothetical protein
MGIAAAALSVTSRAVAYMSPAVGHRAPRQRAPAPVLVAIAFLELQHALAAFHLALDFLQGPRHIIGCTKSMNGRLVNLLRCPAEHVDDRRANALEIAIRAGDDQEIQRQREEAVEIRLGAAAPDEIAAQGEDRQQHEPERQDAGADDQFLRERAAARQAQIPVTTMAASKHERSDEAGPDQDLGIRAFGTLQRRSVNAARVELKTASGFP